MNENLTVTVRLKGGLGNQMFQYAMGRALALRLKAALKLDILSGFAVDTIFQRKYALQPFNIVDEYATPYESYMTFLPVIRRKLSYLLGVVKKFDSKKYFRENSYNFDSRLCHFVPRKKAVYLDGYWQSEKYFIDAEESIREEFTLRESFNARNEKYAADIRSCNSVSLHVRRADYVNHDETRHRHFICEKEYYDKAIEIVGEKMANPHFFIFSDDPEWVNGSLSLDFPATVISELGSEKAHEELVLMSLCQHNIIANSSFSWWGAWLNENPTKIIISPKKWFNNIDVDMKDRLPLGWLGI